MEFEAMWRYGGKNLEAVPDPSYELDVKFAFNRSLDFSGAQECNCSAMYLLHV